MGSLLYGNVSVIKVKLFNLTGTYEGHPISSDNDPIKQDLFL